MTNGSNYLLWGALIFAASFVISATVVVLVLVKLPPTYFLDRPQRRLWVDHHPTVRLILILLKNLAGLGLVAAGALLSLPGIPGQGVLTMVIGMMLLDFPGKRRLERKIVSQPRLRAVINRIRDSFRQQPLQFAERSTEPGHDDS